MPQIKLKDINTLNHSLAGAIRQLTGRSDIVFENEKQYLQFLDENENTLKELIKKGKEEIAARKVYTKDELKEYVRKYLASNPDKFIHLGIQFGGFDEPIWKRIPRPAPKKINKFINLFSEQWEGNPLSEEELKEKIDKYSMPRTLSEKAIKILNSPFAALRRANKNDISFFEGVKNFIENFNKDFPELGE